MMQTSTTPLPNSSGAPSVLKGCDHQRGVTDRVSMDTSEYKVLFFSCDSWNYTFYSSGSIGTILLLNLITNYTYDKSFFMWTYAFQYTSLIGIICISYKYFDTYITNFQRLSSQHKNSFGC
jgi:hypothetical protein